MVAYYEARTTKFELAEYFAGEELDQVLSKINMFFFRIDSNFMEPFAIYVTKSKFIIIEQYASLLEILFELKGYITDEDFHSSLHGFKIWKRQLVTLANNVVEYRETSRSSDTLPEDLEFKNNGSMVEIKLVIDEHVKSYYEGVRDEVNTLRATIDGYSRDLTQSVDSVNNLLTQYKKDTDVDRDFIKYVANNVEYIKMIFSYIMYAL